MRLLLGSTPRHPIATPPRLRYAPPVNDAYRQRFGGIDRLYGKGTLDYFCGLHLCVVGMGGVGSWAVEALARSGIGALTLIDWDVVCLTNTNRQIHALSTVIDAKKTAVLADRIHLINPECKVNVIDDYVRTDNVRDYLSPERGYAYVIDAIDSISYKAAVIYQCRRNKIPVIATGGAGGQTDPTQIHIKDLSRTYNDPLAAKVRAKLRDDYNFPRNPQRYFGVECVFSGQQQVYPRPDGSVSHRKPGIHGVNLDCNLGYGAASFVTGAFGFVAVSRALQKLLKRRASTAASGAQPGA